MTAIMAIVHELQPGSALGSYRVESVERTDGDAVVLRAGDVLLHVSENPRLLDRARRLHSLEHPHLLRLHGACRIDAHLVAILQAPTGTRLDRGAPVDALAVVRQLAVAVEVLEDAGAEVPSITPERVWVGEDGAAVLDGLGAQTHGVSPAAELAGILEDRHPRRSAGLDAVLTRAREGAYLSAGQLAAELERVEDPPRRRWWQRA